MHKKWRERNSNITLQSVINEPEKSIRRRKAQNYRNQSENTKTAKTAQLAMIPLIVNGSDAPVRRHRDI